MGIAITVAIVVVVVVLVLVMRGGGGGGASFPPGTRAFESQMSLGILDRMIAAREQQLSGSLDDATRALVTRQLSNLRKQVELHSAVIAARDVSPGKMSIGVNPDSDRID